MINSIWMMVVIIHCWEKVMERSPQKAVASIKRREWDLHREGEKQLNISEQPKVIHQ